MENVEFVKALEEIFKLSSLANKYFNEKEIWKLIKSDENEAKIVMYNLLQMVEAFRVLISPFFPETHEKLSSLLGREALEPVVGEEKWKFEEKKDTHLGGVVEVLFQKIETDNV